MKSQTPVISNPALSAAFERKNRQPGCLDIVLDNMIRQGLIMKMSDFTKVEQEKGWLSWGIDVFVQTPMHWGFSYAHSFLNVDETEEKFIILSVIKDLSIKILNRYYELIDSEWMDSAVFLAQLRCKCKDICSETNFQHAIVQLRREKRASIFIENGQQVIKFKKLGEQKIEPLSEVDKSLLSMQTARNKVLKDMETIETNIVSCDQEAKNFVKTGFKSKVLDDFDEVQRTLSQSVSADESSEELQEELENLIAEDERPLEEEARTEPPSGDIDDELLRRLEVLRAPSKDISLVKKPELKKQ